MTVRDVVAMGRLPFRPWWQWTNEIDDNRAVDAALTACHLEAFVQRDFAMLSSGERQRVWIAAAFAQTTSHLLLDEPTSRLDIRYAIDVLRLLRIAATNGSTVIASMHDLERAALFADRIIILGEGRVIADGAPADVLTSAILYRAYGVTIDVRHEKGQVWLAAQVQ
jgi:iron complex transport system ATP-binding protein